MHALAHRSIAAAALSAIFILSAIATAHAQEVPPDYDLVGGHFYRQAAGDAARAAGQGFRISNDDGVPFWTEFQRLGGVEALGYPISQRFYLDGFLCQATQRGILQWHPKEERVRLLNVMEYLTKLGADRYLADVRAVPPPAAAESEDIRNLWLDMNSKIRTVYNSATDPIAVFGLPLSPAQAMGPAVAMRFQRGVIYVWNKREPWTGPDQVSVANVGDLVKEVKGLPADALQPEKAPPAREIAPPPRPPARPENRLSGVATWYGAYFQGSPMANGEIYDMWDPTLAASNSHRLGTRLRVTRVATGESIVVRVTDRGAFRYPIIVDLSYAAFSKLADPDDGVIRIVVEQLE